MRKYRELMERVKLTSDPTEGILARLQEDSPRHPLPWVACLALVLAAGLVWWGSDSLSPAVWGKPDALYPAETAAETTAETNETAGEESAPASLEEASPQTFSVPINEAASSASLLSLSSAQALSERVGFPCDELPSLEEKAQDTLYQVGTEGQGVITYFWEGQTVTLQKAPQEERLSAMEDLAQDAAPALCEVLRWETGGYTYTLTFAPPIPWEEAEALREELP